MIHSMTGFGTATQNVDDVRIDVEVRSVNGRFLKVNSRLPESLRALENDVEKRVRTRIQRGSVSLTVRIDRTSPEAKVNVNEDVALAYKSVFGRLGLPLHAIPTLSGVIGGARDEWPEEVRAAVIESVDTALSALVELRRKEGDALADHLARLCDQIDSHRDRVTKRAPQVLIEYRDKLRERIDALLQGSDVEIDEATLAREVAVQASRCDVTEEVERISAHLTRVRELLSGAGEAGRILDFVAQELLRESNTIGSKSSDPQLAAAVIDLKADIERFKEQAANVE